MVLTISSTRRQWCIESRRYTEPGVEGAEEIYNSPDLFGSSPQVEYGALDVDKVLDEQT